MRYYSILGLMCFIANILYSQTNTPLIKIVAEDRADSDQFGWATCIFDNYCVVGTPQKKAKKVTGHRLLQEGGEAYIFTKNVKGVWLQTQVLLPDNPKSLDFFGGSVCMYDNCLAIGANGDDDGTDENDRADSRKGAVYMYKLDKLGKWNKTQKILLDNRDDYDNFGVEVCLFKKKLAVGSIQRSFSDYKFKGAVYIYEQIANGGWVQKQIIKCPEKDILFFGETISLSDSLMVVGSREGKDAFIYKLNKSNQWVLLNKLSATDKSDVSFGSSVFINNNIICVGALGTFENFDGSGNNADTIAFRNKNLLGAGSVYIYEIDIKNQVNFQQRITAKDIKADMHFGMCLGMSDSLLVVGAFGDALDIKNLPNNRYGGAAYIFKQDKYGKWVETKKIVSPIRSVWDKFAFSVSVFNKTIIIGSRLDKENAQEKNPINNAGSAYIYEYR